MLLKFGCKITKKLSIDRNRNHVVKHVYNSIIFKVYFIQRKKNQIPVKFYKGIESLNKFGWL